jgi:hypothetical protein
VSGAIEQRQSEPPFQAIDLHAQRRLHHVELARGARYAALLVQANKILDLPQVQHIGRPEIALVTPQTIT